MKAKLTTLTPVHIGNGTTLNKNIDFIQVGDKIGIVDEKKAVSYTHLTLPTKRIV